MGNLRSSKRKLKKYNVILASKLREINYKLKENLLQKIKNNE